MPSFRLVSRLLLLIVMFTMLSPGFAADVIAAEDHHAQLDGMSAGHDAIERGHDHDADEPAGDGHADHHAGDGYLFTHLPAQVSASPLIPPAAVGDDFAPAISWAPASHSPARLERPPRLRSA
ncbi:MAG: hypothetical protein NDI67_06295 [Sulfuritalea sp.]|nr:hypothetical protein [Sulfuritalea sp.]